MIYRVLSWIGKTIGNWNDRTNAVGDGRYNHSRHWHVLDRIAGWLYIQGDKA